MRSIEGLQTAFIVFVLESNLAYESQHITNMLYTKGIPRWALLKEGAGGSAGWLTTAPRKEEMCLNLRGYLTGRKISMYENFVSTHNDVPTTLSMLKSELKNYCVIVEAPNTPFGKVKKTYGGKIGNRQDDLCIAMQLALIGMEYLYKSDKYRKLLLL